MCWFAKDKKPIIPSLVISSQYVRQEIEGIKLLYPALLDEGQLYTYTTATGWAEVFNYIYFKYKMPEYVEARFDCEDFALLLKGLVSYLFGLNYFGFVIGQSPEGFHSWSIFRTDDGLCQLEPQTGEIFPLSDSKYKAEYILL